MTPFHVLFPVNKQLQSQRKLLEKVFAIMSTFLRNKTISKTMPLRKENPFPQFNVASYKRPGIRLSFEYTTTLLSGEGGEGRTGTATMFRKMLSKYTIFSTVLSKIVAYSLLFEYLLTRKKLSLRHICSVSLNLSSAVHCKKFKEPRFIQKCHL